MSFSLDTLQLSRRPAGAARLRYDVLFEDFWLAGKGEGAEHLISGIYKVDEQAGKWAKWLALKKVWQ